MLFAYLLTTDADLAATVITCPELTVTDDLNGLRFGPGQPILLDENWPGVWDVIYGQREQHIIMLTDDETPTRIMEYITAGAADYVPKALIDAVLITRLQSRQDTAFITKFVRLMAHDVKNPLASVRGYAQALTDPDMRAHIDETELAEFLETIVNNAMRTEAMINRVRDTAFTEQRTTAAHRTHLDMVVVLGEEVTNIAPYMEAKHHYLMTEIPSRLPWIMADHWLIKQVLAALLHNAVTYTPPHGTICLLADTVRDSYREYVQITVADSGVGIPPADQHKVFTRWFRGQHDAEQDDWRLGVNLYQAQRIVTAHGGRIWFESEPGRGSTFYVSLPART